ncbi:unnamed protein product [Periconia digitata]|uniref:Nuclear GTPase SLIP-GC n=1 Tax=Periconia digitata TaxID=1303443 RepID=A0A9W4XN27_9PLEO|nr:unnamed protein product [Periconia digitata]
MEWDEIHQQAKNTVTGSTVNNFEADRYLVGIIKLNEPLHRLGEFQLLWIKVTGKVTVRKFQNVYMEHQPDVEIKLHFQDEDISLDTACEDLDLYRDKLIVLRAMEKDASGHATRIPPSAPSTLLDFPTYHPTTSPHSRIKQERQSPQPLAPDNPEDQDAIESMAECRLSPASHSEPTLLSDGSFDLSQVFNREDSEERDKSAVTATYHYIDEVMGQDDPDILEASALKALDMLTSIKSILTRHSNSSPDAATWKQAVEELESQAERERPRTIIGVVGNTGAGKSSVINALLDEERLVPTNCMRACTAVVTSISHNTSKDTSTKYRAEIQFIEPADWERELRILMTEFSENGTLSAETKDPNSDAGVAWSKFKAVYPKIPKDALRDWTPEKLMGVKTVLDCLGTTKHVNSASPDRFYAGLQKYVDSKEKTGVQDRKGKKDKKDKLSSPEIEYWPLIKEVRIYTKAKALETGAVVVDLPGVHDSNAARAAVAERYIKQCTGLWIVAPINRAVDDKAAKNLLGDSFKRQLKYDGNYSNVTFICSKTDDISITEATDSLGLHSEMSDLEDRYFGYETELTSIEKAIKESKDSIAVYQEMISSHEKETEIWEDLKDSVEEGKRVFAPLDRSAGKRKRRSLKKKSRKRQQPIDSDLEYDDSDEDYQTDADMEGEADGEVIKTPQQPLAINDIKSKINQLRHHKKNARDEKALVQEKITDSRKKAHRLKEKMDEIRGAMSALCISGRNEYSKGAIQQDFAAGIRELDMENAEEEDEEHFDPTQDLRDYDDVACSLPVFCVSSRAYQKMSGRLKKDDPVPGFKTLAETEMPQLQEHCRQPTAAKRLQSSRKLLLGFKTQLTAYSLWASSDNGDLNMSEDDKSQQLKHLEKRLGELEKGFERTGAACIHMINKELQNQIYDRYPNLVNEAVREAPQIANRWGSHKSEGGLHYITYKAVCKRFGVYLSSTAGHRDFNADLTDSIIKQMATGWERAFQNRLPAALDGYTDACGSLLHKFHETIEQSGHEAGTSLVTLSLLRSSISSNEQLFRDKVNDFLTIISDFNREANREFVPVVAYAMEEAYKKCVDEAGTGSYMRMRDHMTSHVEVHRYKMFTTASQTVIKSLTMMCDRLEKCMSTNANGIFASVRASYLRAFSGLQVSQNVRSRSERILRAELVALLNQTDELFEPIVKGGALGAEFGVQDAAEENTSFSVVHRSSMAVDEATPLRTVSDVDTSASSSPGEPVEWDPMEV